MRFSRRTFTLSAAAPIFVPLVGSAQNATPAVTDNAPIIDRLNEMLQYAPGGILDADFNLIWNDHQRQVAAIRQHNGMTAEEQPNQQFAMTSLVANAPALIMYAHVLKDLTGFSYDALDQTLAFFSVPDTCLIARLNQPAEEIIPFLESVDYEPRENEFGTFWTIGETGDIDLNHPVQSQLMASHNNVAMIADDTIAYAPTSELLEQIMSSAAGGGPNRIAELEPLAAGLKEDSTSAWFFDGDLFALENLSADSVLPEQIMLQVEELIADSDDVAGQMPAFRSVGVGVTGGGSLNEELHDPASQEFIILETDEAGQANHAADVLAWRVENMFSLNTGVPYAQLLPDLKIEVLDGELLRASSPLEPRRTIFSQMIQARDTLLFAYTTPE